MEITFGPFGEENLAAMRQIWNDILQDGLAFPGEEPYTPAGFEEMLALQSSVGCLFASGRLAGYYVLHPNNIGRCGHVANASYAIAKEYRGQKLAEPLVRHSVQTARALGFRGMQFNAVVVSNLAALRTYQKIGFAVVGTIPGGFRLKSGEYSDMHILYLPLV